MNIAIDNTKSITSQRTMLAIPLSNMSRITARQPIGRSNSDSLIRIRITDLHAVRLNSNQTIINGTTKVLINIRLNRSLRSDASATIKHSHAVTTLDSEISQSKLDINGIVSIHNKGSRETILRLNMRINCTSKGLQIQIIQSSLTSFLIDTRS